MVKTRSRPVGGGTTDPRNRVLGRRLSQRAGHDPTGPVHAEMELPPAASPLAPMCRRGPRTVADEGQSGAVNDEVQAGARAGAPKREGERLTASRERGVIGGREIDAQHPEDRGQDALGLTQRSVEEETERQGGFDGEIGILELPAPPADASRCPRGDRVGREPEGDVASPHEGSVVLGPVPDAIRCRVRRMHSRLHIEIMTRRRSRWSTCRPLLAHRAESAHQRPNLLRRYGRAPRGARVHDHAPCGRWQTRTLLAAVRVTGLTAPGVFDGAIDGERFRAYIDQILVPTLPPGDIVMADTLGAHKVAGIQRAIQAAGATLWYLPPDSPDLNPIERCFAKLTALVRTARCRSPETLWPFLGECLAHFSPDECRHYVRHGGYAAATRS